MLANHIINGEIITVILNGAPNSIRPGHKNYEKILEHILNNSDLPLKDWNYLLNPAVETANNVNAYNPALKVELKGGYIYYHGMVLNNYLTSKILEFKEKGLPHKPLIKFLENLMQNPSRNCIDWLYKFLENKEMAITQDGCFLGYKGVKKDYSSISIYNGQNGNPYIVSPPGATVKIDRWLVSDNFESGCDRGLHVGSYSYAKNWAAGGKVILVKVNPKDCVSVPKREHEKLRCCEYYVVKDVTNPLSESLYSQNDANVNSNNHVNDSNDVNNSNYNENYDENYDDDYEYDEYGSSF